MADAATFTNPERTSLPLAQALREAAAAMRRGDIAAAQRSLQRAAELTRQAGQQIAAQEATERALRQIQESRREIAQSGQGQRRQGPGQQGQRRTGSQGSGSGRRTGSHGDSDGQGGTPGDPRGPISPTDVLWPHQPGQEGEKRYDPIYAPERLGGDGGERIDLPGQGEDEGPTTGEIEGGPRDKGQVLVPYNEIYTDYESQAARALENSYIPRGMKEYVRAYFSSLEPKE